MTMDEKGVAGLPAARELDFHWGSIIAGALAATALAFVLNSFALALGLSVSSAAPTWRETSFVLVFLSGLYLILVAIASYAFGAYLAARMRVPLAINSDTAEFQDGVHGLIIWAIATLLTGIVALGTLQLIPRASAPTSVAGESIIAFDLDHLFRGSERRNDNDLTYDRSQAARILFTTSSHSGMDSSDRAYLARLVATDTGIAPADAERRVEEVSARAKEDIHRARASGVILAFMAGAAALLGAATAWMAARTGGHHRDGYEPIPAFWDWGNTTDPRRGARVATTSNVSTPRRG